jgi:hypothetical protein
MPFAFIHFFEGHAPADPSYGRPAWSPADPGYGMPGWAAGRPDAGLPISPGHPTGGFPVVPALPGYDLPFAPGHPTGGFPVAPARPDAGLPWSPGHASGGFPVAPAYPTGGPIAPPPMPIKPGDDTEPGTIYPPIAGGGKYWVLLWLVGHGYKWSLIDLDLKPGTPDTGTKPVPTPPQVSQPR